MNYEKLKRTVESTNASISIPVSKSFKIELRFKREKCVLCESINSREAKVFFLGNGLLIVRYDDGAKRLRYAFLDKGGRLKELGEL